MARKTLPDVTSLSLEEKVGQILMVGFSGQDPEGARQAVTCLRVGGIIYFSRNTGSVAKTASLSAALQSMAAESGVPPLLISADQEGGIVARLTDGLPLMPGPMSLGATGDPELAFDVSRAIGTQVRAAGINMDLAPDLDVNDNPLNPVIGVRSFGSNPSLVGTLGAAAARGFMAAGIAPVGKHFPGHGNTTVDSHLDLPVLPHSMDRLNEVELLPFKAAIRAGVPAIMTAHIVFKAVDPRNPATLSEAVLTGLLRRSLGFQGIIITDCLEMSAISKNPGTARGAVLALRAGADVLLISHSPERQKEAYLGILEAVKAGEVPMSRLDDAVNRILSLKRALRIPNPIAPEEADSTEFRNLSSRAHLRSITIVRDEGGLIPLRRLEGARTVPGDRPGPRAHPLRIAVASAFPPKPLVEALSAEEGVEAFTICEAADEDAAPRRAVGKGDSEKTDVGRTGLGNADVYRADLGKAGLDEFDVVLLLTQNAWKDPQQTAFAKAVLAKRPDAVVVAARDPYDLRALPEARTFLCAYSHRPEALRAVAQVLLGRAKAEGSLPEPAVQGTLPELAAQGSLPELAAQGSLPELAVRQGASRKLIGLMSGTSADGVDAALCEITGSGKGVSARVLRLTSIRYPDNIRRMLLGDLSKLTSEEVARLNFAIGDVFADVALKCLSEAELAPDQVDAVSSHGQTLAHFPYKDHPSIPWRATLQVGDISVIAQKTGILTIGDFRPADMAQGGQGAPLVPYVDYLLMGHPSLGRIVQNIGGIGNLTYLPPNCSPDKVIAFDTGPGNMVVDAVVSILTGGREPMDEDGRMASSGRVCAPLLEKLLDNRYFGLKPPKSTGRELFGIQYARSLLEAAREMGCAAADDIVATASEITVQTIVNAYKDFVFPFGPVDEVIVGGGGARNLYFMGRLRDLLPKAKVLTHDDLGIPNQAKEALAFAILGNEVLSGRTNNLPSATGARKKVVMGKIALP